MIGIAAVTASGSPFDSATITRVENTVTVGEVAEGKTSARRPAVVSAVVKANHFVHTGSQSRAELQFKDSSLVRVGQNSVFSFEAKSRTLSLEKGDMLFYVAPGQGSGTIKTPALTAAITGTLCKVAPDLVAVLRGTITVTVNGEKVKVPAGWAVKVFKRKAQLFQFDPNEANRGKLYSMGPLPEEPGIQIKKARSAFHFPGLHPADAIDSAVVNPVVQQSIESPRPVIPALPPVAPVQTPPPVVVKPPPDRIPIGGQF